MTPLLVNSNDVTAALTTLNATNLTTGTVPFARLVNTQTVGNANATIAVLTRDVLLNVALTAPRVYTLPLASAYPAGARVSFTDMANTLSVTNTATLLCTGADLINGLASLVLNTSGASPILISDGSGKWNVDIRGISRGGTGATTAAGARAALGVDDVIAVITPRLFTLANAAARKTLATYSPAPRVGADRVIQSDLPSIVWLLTAADVTLDTSWLPMPITNNAGELVGPIIGRMILESDTTTVPNLGEQTYVVDALPVFTRAEQRIGDGVTVKGLRAGRGVLNVTTDVAKRALTSVAIDQIVKITGEGNRIERFLGGAISDNLNWLVIRDSVFLIINVTAPTPAMFSIRINGGAFAGVGQQTVGQWVDPSMVNFSTVSSAGAYQIRVKVTGYDSSLPPAALGCSYTEILNSTPTGKSVFDFSGNMLSLPFVNSRGRVDLAVTMTGTSTD